MSYQQTPQGYSQVPQPSQPLYPQQPMYQTPPPQMMPPQMQQPPKRRSKTWLWIIALFVVFFVGISVGSGMHSGDTTSAATNASNTAQSGGAAAPAPTAKPLAWKTTHSYSGNGAKKTETFTAPGDWKIAYTCKGMSIDGMTATANLQVYVYGSDGSMQDVAVNETCAAGKADSGTTEEHQGGQVYLDINADSDWTLKVQEQK